MQPAKVKTRLRFVLKDQAASISCAGALIVLIAVYAAREPQILSSFGLASLANVSVTLALAAIGQTIVLLSAGLDLSIGAEITLINCFAATTMGASAFSITRTVIAALLIGSATGAFNGFVIAYGRIAPLIATFCTSFIFFGASLIILPRPGGSIPESFAVALTGSWGPLPLSIVLLAAAVLFIWVPVFRSRLGRSITAIGDSPESARVSGLPVRRVTMTGYMLAGLFAAIAALFLGAQTTSGDPTIGEVYTLNSFAAAVLGGVSLMGGRGTVIGPILGSFVLSIVLNALGAFNISAFWQDLVEGLILILVLSAGGLRILKTREWLALLRQ